MSHCLTLRSRSFLIAQGSREIRRQRGKTCFWKGFITLSFKNYFKFPGTSALSLLCMGNSCLDLFTWLPFCCSPFLPAFPCVYLDSFPFCWKDFLYISYRAGLPGKILRIFTYKCFYFTSTFKETFHQVKNSRSAVTFNTFKISFHCLTCIDSLEKSVIHFVADLIKVNISFCLGPLCSLYFPLSLV